MEKVTREIAVEDFERFKDAMRLRLDREGMDENERKDVREDIEILTLEIMAGRAIVNENDQVVYYPEDCDPLTFIKPKGGNVAVIDKKKDSQKVGQAYALIGAFTGVAPSKIGAMDWADIDICMSIVSLFFVK